MKAQQTEFKGKKYILIGGSIATRKQYKNGLPSYAHLYKDGNIYRDGKIIGTKKDIKYLKKVPTKVPGKAFGNIIDAFMGEEL